MKKPDLQPELGFGSVDPGRFAPPLEVPLVQNQLGLKIEDNGSYTDILKPSSNGNGHHPEPEVNGLKGWKEFAEELGLDDDYGLPPEWEEDEVEFDEESIEDEIDRWKAEGFIPYFDKDGRFHPTHFDGFDLIEDDYEPTPEELYWLLAEETGGAVQRDSFEPPELGDPDWEELSRKFEYDRLGRFEFHFHDFGSEEGDENLDPSRVEAYKGVFVCERELEEPYEPTLEELDWFHGVTPAAPMGFEERILSNKGLVFFFRQKKLKLIPPPSYLDEEDIIAAGFVGLAEGALRYNPNQRVKGQPFHRVKFSSYAGRWIFFAILHALKEGYTPPKKTRTEIENMHYWGVFTEEQAKRRGMSVRRYRDLLEMDRAWKTTSISMDGLATQVHRGFGERLPFEAADPNPRARPDEVVVRDDQTRRLNSYINSLSSVGGRIISLCFVGQMADKAIGEKLDISEAEVRAQKISALAELRRIMEPEKEDWF